MKKIRILIAAAMAALMLTGCCLSHDWQPASCTAPETCSKCDETKGEALGHSWVDADCVTPKTCSVCGETEGEALGHSWVEADCVTPKTCSVCGETEGEALGHSWVEADCVTPKTCSVCGETEGEALGHSWVEADCVTPKTCSACGETEGEALGHSWVDADCVTPKTCSVCGETEGEALGHSWVEADCVTPKTCSVCGETEGEALGHSWVEADCVTPKTCSVCGEIEGEALGHSWVDADCVTPKTCSACGETEGEALGHQGEEATCTETSVCERCGTVLEAALGHDADEATASRASVCRRCGTVLAEATGYAVTKDSDGYGYINRQGKLVIDLVYDYAYPFSDGMAMVFRGSLTSYGYPDEGLYGYINEVGEEVIPLKYSDANSFHDGVAIVELNGKQVMIDKQGLVLSAFSGYDHLSYFPGNGLIRAFRGELSYGFPGVGTYTIFNLDGNEIFSGNYDRCYIYEDHIEAKKSDKYALLGLDGTEKTGYDLDYLGQSGEGIVSFRKGGLYGAMTIEGEILFPAKFDGLSAFSDGKAIAEKNGFYALVDTDGNTLATYSLDYINTSTGIVENRLITFEGTLTSYGYPDKGSYYLMDLDGNYIGAGYDDMNMVNGEKILTVRKGDKWSVIDLDGELVFSPVACDSLKICGDLFAVKNNNAFTLVNERNEPVSDVTWDDLITTSGDLIPVAKHPVRDFRGTHWGMTEAEVREVEGEPILSGELTGRKANYIAYEGTLMGNSVLYAYYFGANGLYEARYIWTEDHSNESLYITDYKNVKEQITQKYGKPSYDKENWDTSSHKSYYADRKGDALCYGYLTYETIFRTDRTEITMQMDADNYDVSFIIYYESKVVAAPKVDYSNDF